MSHPPANTQSEDDPQLFEGAIAVLALLESDKRRVHRVLIDARKDAEEIDDVLAAARERRFTVERSDAAEIARLAAAHGTGGTTHGGVIALAGPRRYPSLADSAFGPAGDDWHVMLDGIEDPFNFGQSVRALYAAGAAGLVLRQRSWRGGDGIVARASAGATERMPTRSTMPSRSFARAAFASR
jgi:23S rRNA (guanosine2251-2'-O)-methyltransferase